MTKLLFLAALVAAVVWLFRRPAKASVMPRDEAARLLGIGRDADAGTVVEAHRRLIARVHPDAGGSAELAAQINRARDTMLKP